MAESEHEWISKRAYTLWEEEGYPTGKDSEHWERARQEYLLFAPLGVTKGLPKGKKPKVNGAATEKAATKKTEAVTNVAKPKTDKAAPAKSVEAKPATEKAAETKSAETKPAPAKPAAKAAKPVKAKAIAADAKPAAKTRSKKLAAD
ncbi:DUF2934 domain-containing protein [Rhizobiales bacterium RZME27]|jgi:hypothetical protein|uniref:DUF2934 domain-containing protein n=1 Tax=Endobacterium cereale TaxID=2663029 RepID=A0A6A8AHA3_9HYPH|nr:DUF2934 domain-containing protein [Endobacterium cereale]